MIKELWNKEIKFFSSEHLQEMVEQSLPIFEQVDEKDLELLRQYGEIIVRNKWKLHEGEPTEARDYRHKQFYLRFQEDVNAPTHIFVLMSQYYEWAAKSEEVEQLNQLAQLGCVMIIAVVVMLIFITVAVIITL